MSRLRLLLSRVRVTCFYVADIAPLCGLVDIKSSAPAEVGTARWVTVSSHILLAACSCNEVAGDGDVYS